MRFSRIVVLILGVLVLALLIFAYVDGGRVEPRLIEEEIAVKPGPAL